MTKHTPGPWCFQFTEENGECFVIANNLGGMVGAALPWPTEIEARDFRRVIANARLIAAAPDLFAALNGLIDRHSALVASGDCGFWDVENEDEMKAARAAILKATS